MSEMNDLPEVHRTCAPLLDAGTAERILHGLPGADAPPGYAAVCDLLVEARRIDPAEATAGLHEALAAFRAAHQPRPAALAVVRARRVLVLSTTLMLMTGAGAMAATGTLPAPIQRLADSTFRAVGIPVAAADATGNGASGTAIGARSASAVTALCRAYHSGSVTGTASKASATAFKALADAAGGSGLVDEYCAGQSPAGTTAEGKATSGAGAGTSSGASAKDDKAPKDEKAPKDSKAPKDTKAPKPEGSPASTVPGQTGETPPGQGNDPTTNRGNGGTNPNAGPNPESNGGTNPNAGPNPESNGGTNPNAGPEHNSGNGGTNPNAGPGNNSGNGGTNPNAGGANGNGNGAGNGNGNGNGGE